MIYCCAVVNQPELLNKIQSFCSEILFVQIEGIFSQLDDSIQFINTKTIDLTFFESEINNQSAFPFYEKYKSVTHAIFIGNDKSKAFDAYNVEAIDFLDVEFDFKRFVQAINKAKKTIDFERSLSKFEDTFLLVRSEYKLLKIPHTEITYFETLDDYIKIHMLGKKPVLTLMSIKNLLNKLPSQKFIRVHRSYVIAIHQIVSVRGKIIDLGICEVPIGKSFESEFYKMYLKQGF